MQRALERARARRADEGFTLIELLIVIVILGILAAIVVFSVSGITDKGQKSACKADVATVTTAAEAYYAQNSSYPQKSDNGGYASDTAAAAAELIPGFLHAPFPSDVTYTYVAAAGSTPASFTVTGSGC